MQKCDHAGCDFMKLEKEIKLITKIMFYLNRDI